LFSANLEEGDFVENYRCVYESYHTAQGLWLLNVNRSTQLAELSHIQDSTPKNEILSFTVYLGSENNEVLFGAKMPPTFKLSCTILLNLLWLSQFKSNILNQLKVLHIYSTDHYNQSPIYVELMDEWHK